MLNWLKSIGLGTLRSTFDQHEIDGIRLLSFTKQDLDVLGVKALAHRKLITRHIQKLTGDDAKPDDSTEPKRMHWSRITPLSEITPGNPASSVPVNGADSEPMYNEQQAHDDFQRAVLEWRESQAQRNKPKKLSLLSSETKDDSMWHNPF